MDPRDSFTLAVTKLRVRRVRLGVTLVVMSLLFAGLVFLSVLLAGVVQSVQSFSKEGLGDRYIVQASPILYVPYGNDDLKSKLQQPTSDIIAQKTALAKKYGLTYDAKTDASLPLTPTQIGPSAADTVQMPNVQSPAARAALAEQNRGLGGTYTDFAKVAAAAGASHVYRSSQTSYSSGPQNIKVLMDGREDYSAQQKMQYGPPVGLQSITSLGWSQMSDELLKPFLLPGQTTAVGKDGSVPITVPFSAAEQLLGLHSLPATATNQQKLQRLQDVRNGVAGKLATICYRNEASTQLLQKAIQQQADIAANKNKADYTPPSLQYDLPAAACGPVTVKKDTRTADEKLADAHQAELDAVGNPAPDPQQGSFQIRIVGITTDVNLGGGSSFSANNLLSSILTSSLGQGWLSPVSAFQPDSIVTQAQGGLLTDDLSGQQQYYYAEFPSLAAAKHFIDQRNCDVQQQGMNYNPNALPQQCAARHQPFTIAPFGNNAGAIADLQHSVWKFGRYVLLAVIGIAIVIMMGTLGKIIADSRRETAVFRALGSRRLHISQIYLTYACIIGVFIIVLSGLAGCIGAEVVSKRLEPGLSVGACLAYNAADVHKQFSLFGLNLWYLGGIAVIIMATSVLGSLLPLLLNMRRNPIRDMRDE